MSSLPPYNPPPTERRLWLVNSETPAADLDRLLESAAGAERVRTDDAGELFRLLNSTAEDLVMLAPEDTLLSLVLGLIGGQPGLARMRFLPGAVSQVQILSSHAVVRHLNRGAPL